MIPFSVLEVLLVILAAGLVALAFAVARLSGVVRNRFGEDGGGPAGRAAASGETRAPAAPDVRPGIPGGSSVPGEIVAAIAAAVSCMEPGAVVTSVRRAPQSGVPAWKMAGLLENTRPFF